MKVTISLVLLVIGVMICVYIYRRKIHREIDRLEEWKMSIMNRPMNEELTKIKTLNMSGQTEEMFERWRNEWDEIVATDLPVVEERLFDAEDATDKFRFVLAKNTLKAAEDLLEHTEGRIQAVLAELQTLIGSEAESRVEIEQLREAYRIAKKKLLTHRQSFGKASKSLEEHSEQLQQKFAVFLDLEKNGNYLEAREICFQIAKEVETLERMLEGIPRFSSEIQTIIPAQLTELTEGYKEMTQVGYYVEHIDVVEKVVIFKERLKNYAINLEELKIDEVEQGVNETKEEIDAIYDSLEKEVSSMRTVHREVPTVSEKLYTIYDEIVTTSQEVLHVQERYHVTNSDVEKIRELEKQIAQVAARYALISERIEKRDAAYSVIKEDLDELSTQVNELETGHEEFISQLQTLRKDETEAQEKLLAMKDQVNEVIRMTRKSNLPGQPETHKALIASAKNAIIHTALVLEEVPLNITAVKLSLHDAVIQVEKMFQYTIEMIEKANLAERVIQYGNRFKSNSPMIAELLGEAETSFRSCNYKESLEQARLAVERVEPHAFEKIQALYKKNQEDREEIQEEIE